MRLGVFALLTLFARASGVVVAGEVDTSVSPAPGTATIQAAEGFDQSLLHFPGALNVTAYPGIVFSGDRGCSPSALLSFLTFERQVVPVEEQNHIAVRLLQTPSTGAVPDNVVWFDLETGVLVTGIPKLNWTQQTTVFNYTLLTPGVVDLPRYRIVLASLGQLVTGLAQGSALSNSRYQCAASNPALEELAEYISDIQADIANASAIDGGLKKGIEYRVPSGCIVELDALYAGDPIGSTMNLSQGAAKQPTEDDCCRACRSAASCNVFVFCPSFEGCRIGDVAFPAFGCQLKQLANLSSDPTAFPASLARGPPTVFKSGRLA